MGVNVDGSGVGGSGVEVGVIGVAVRVGKNVGVGKGVAAGWQLEIRKEAASIHAASRVERVMQILLFDIRESIEQHTRCHR